MISDNARSPLYVIVDQDSEECLASAEEIVNFFVDTDEPESGVVRLRGMHDTHSARRRSERAELRVCDFRGKTIGAYYLGRVEITGSHDERSFTGYTYDYPQAGEVWKRWASTVALELGEWKRYPPSYHRSWLHVTQVAWFTAHQSVFRASREDSRSVDGAMMFNKYSFYCALGEALNGPGGYFGSNLDALADCLSSVRASAPIRQLRWNNFSASLDSLGRDYVAAVVSVLEKADVTIHRG
ncbi:barstar family protein [Streptomyces sp. NPDC006326]|uniref:barstar family protein n=1 Tax=Streptomyces sp. NPDC006326 TaxID=3156752 RepID=UPI0033B8FBBB